MRILRGGITSHFWTFLLLMGLISWKTGNAQRITSDFKLAGRPGRVWVDKLEVKELPKIVAPIKFELSQGDWVELTGARTVMASEITLQNRRIRAPWLEIKTGEGNKAWVFGAGVRLCGQPGARLSPEKEFAPIGWIDVEQDFLRDLDDNEAIITFRFVNAGPRPVEIKRIKTSCECLQVRASEKPVAPCRKGGVQLRFQLKQENPDAIETALIYFDGYELPYVVSLRVLTGQALVEKGHGLGDDQEGLEKAALPPTATQSKYFVNGLVSLHNQRSGRYFRPDGTALTDFPHYDYFHLKNTLNSFQEGLTVIRKKRLDAQDGNLYEYFYADQNGENPFGRTFDYARDFKNGLAVVGVGEKYGVIDQEGNFTVEPEYAVVSDPVAGMCWVLQEDEGPELLIDGKTGEMIPENSRRRQQLYPIPLKTKKVEVEGKDYEVMKYALVDKTGALISPWLDQIPVFRDGLTSFSRGPRWGFLDKTGKMVIHPRFAYVTEFSDGYAQYSWDPDPDTNLKGFINTSGQIMIENSFAYVEDFVNGYCIFREPNWKGPNGFINKKGEVVVQPRYEEAYNFYEGLAAVKSNGKWGFIDENGLPTIPFAFDEVRHMPGTLEGGFSGGICKVVFRGTEVLIDKEGNCVMGCGGW